MSRGENVGHGSKGPKGLAFRTLGTGPLFSFAERRSAQCHASSSGRSLLARVTSLHGPRGLEAGGLSRRSCSQQRRFRSCHASRPTRCSSVACDRLCGHLAWLLADLSWKQLAATSQPGHRAFGPQLCTWSQEKDHEAPPTGEAPKQTVLAPEGRAAGETRLAREGRPVAPACSERTRPCGEVRAAN